MHRSRISNKIIEFVVLTLVVLICSALARGTTVTATLVDGVGQALANGKVTVEFVPAPGTYGSPVIPAQNVTLSNTGGFSITLTATNTITPSGGTYKFTICPNATTNCSIVSNIQVIGTTLDVSSQLNPGISTISTNAQALVPKAYTDSEVPITDLTNTGAMYWNVLDSTLHLWNGISWSSIPSSRTIFNNYYTSAEIDGGTFADECAAIAGAIPYAQSKGWTSIHVVSGWVGTQHCAQSPYVNFPYTPGATATFSEWIDFLPGNLIQIDVPVIIPSNVHEDHHAPHSGFGNNPFAASGYQASNTFDFTTNKALIEFGAANGTAFSTGTPPQGVQIENAGIYCIKPNGTFSTGSIGIRNQFAQENSWGHNLHIDGCEYGIDRQNSGGISGSLNDGPWEELHINMAGGTVNSRCIRVGKFGAANSNANNSRGFHNVSCNINGIVAQPAIGIQVDGVHIPFTDIHLEGFAEGIVLGSVGYSKNNTMSEINCVGFVANPMTNCVRISNNNEFGNTSGNVIMNVVTSGSPGTTNIFKDDMTFGGTIAFGGTCGGLSFYTHQPGPTVISSCPDIPSRLTFASGTALSSIGAPTADSTIGMGGFQWSLQSNATQNKPIFNLSGTGTNANSYSLFSINTVGANERTFTFTNLKTAFQHSTATGDLQLTPVPNATSAAPINSSGYLTQGKFWDGAASQTLTFRPGITFSPTSGTTTSATIIDAISNSGLAITMIRDFTPYNSIKASGGSANKAICWKADGKTLGFCSTVVDAAGGCTCN